MKISTKVECGIIAIADIAMNSENGETVTVYSVAERRGLSGKYLEQVLTSLRQARLIKGIKGSRGRIYTQQKAREDNTQRNNRRSRPIGAWKRCCGSK